MRRVTPLTRFVNSVLPCMLGTSFALKFCGTSGWEGLGWLLVATPCLSTTSCFILDVILLVLGWPFRLRFQNLMTNVAWKLMRQCLGNLRGLRLEVEVAIHPSNCMFHWSGFHSKRPSDHLFVGFSMSARETILQTPLFKL